MNNKIIISYISLFLLTLQNVSAEPYALMSRYVTVVEKPQHAQINLLSQTIQMHFPQDVKTLSDAINYLLRFSGYSLAPNAELVSALKITLSKPLPLIDRNFGPMTLKEGLLTLVGPVFVLAQDPINRTVNFHLKPSYRHFKTH